MSFGCFLGQGFRNVAWLHSSVGRGSQRTCFLNGCFKLWPRYRPSMLKSIDVQWIIVLSKSIIFWLNKTGQCYVTVALSGFQNQTQALDRSSVLNDDRVNDIQICLKGVTEMLFSSEINQRCPEISVLTTLAKFHLKTVKNSYGPTFESPLIGMSCRSGSETWRRFCTIDSAILISHPFLTCQIYNVRVERVGGIAPRTLLPLHSHAILRPHVVVGRVLRCAVFPVSSLRTSNSSNCSVMVHKEREIKRENLLNYSSHSHSQRMNKSGRAAAKSVSFEYTQQRNSIWRFCGVNNFCEH